MRTESLALVIYALAAAVVALAVLEGRKYGRLDWINAPQTTREYQSLNKELAKKGSSKQGTDRVWQYTKPAFDRWWKKVEDANWVGREPVVEEMREPEKVEKAEPKPVAKPLEEIFSISVMLAGDSGRLKIHYKDSSVRPPQPPVTGDSLAQPMPMQQSPGDPMNQGTGIYQDLIQGDLLYEPFDSIRFEGFSKDGLAAFFSRSVPGEEERRTDRMQIAEFNIDNDVFASVAGREDPYTAKLGKLRAQREKIAYRDPGPKSKQDAKSGVFFISTPDSERFRKEPNRIINEDLTAVDWEPSATVRKATGIRGGVQIKSVSPQMKNLGVQSGEILIKVNGQAVHSRASAIKVGRRQYQAGTRTFNLTFLDKTAREVVRTYRAPDK
ncbi:MAG: hypothetical protein CSA62_03560 [Planctomycetota bacterium]|nr:MAG: hypothetical protein CSA62_03560 [Planctomycetota bacterium]